MQATSSVSGTTLEEGVVDSLVMLSRDIWMRDFRKNMLEKSKNDEENEIEHEEEREEEQNDKILSWKEE
ncbi:hypothetical protein AAC387_Pa01g4419 [Persea americana]